MKAGFLQTAIATEIGVHKSTISRELRRNRGKKGYRPKQAHVMALERRTKAHKYIKLTPQLLPLLMSASGRISALNRFPAFWHECTISGLAMRLSISMFSTIRPKEVNYTAICASLIKSVGNATVPMIVEDRYKVV
jgi:hypothetical protein